MSATIARQVGRVQLEQSDMRLALNMGNMVKDGFSHATIEETKYLIKRPRAEVREQMKRGVEFPGHKNVKAAIQRHLAMLHHNQMSGWLPCHNGTAKNPQTRWRRKGTGAPPPARSRVRTPELTPPPPGTPPTPTGNTSGAQLCEIVNLPALYTYSYTALPSAELFEDDEHTQQDTDSDPDMLTDDG
jgi:hypothetical protein